MEKKFKLGILGLGEGISILSAACRSQLAEPTLLCDLDEALCQERCKSFGLERYTTSYDEMLADPRIDCIAIYTPDPLHAQHIIAAIKAGKHVICTKPLVKGLQMAAELWNATKDSDRKLLVGQSCRFFDTFMRQHAKRSTVGELISVETHYNGDKRGGTSGRWGKAGAVDWLYTGLSHPVDMAYWHLGDIETVSGVATQSPAAKQQGQQSPDNFHFTLKAKSGAIGRVTGCFGAAQNHPEAESMIGCTLRGSEGTTQADYPNFNFYSNTDTGGATAQNSNSEHAYYFRWGGAMHHAGEFQNYLEYFLQCIASGERARPDLSDGIKVIATLEAMARAIKTGQPARPDDLLREFGLSALVNG